jgi:hypothetical protein
MDGVKWTSKILTTAPAAVFNAAVYTGKNYVVAGGGSSGCEIWVSGDGINWTNRTPAGCLDTINDLVVAKGSVVGVGGTATFSPQPIVIRSIDHGNTWTMNGGTGGAADPPFDEIVFDGTYFEAMGIILGVPTLYRSLTTSGFTVAPNPNPLDSFKNPCQLGHLFHLPGTTRTFVSGTSCTSTPNPSAFSYSDNAGQSIWPSPLQIFGPNTVSEIPLGMAYNGTRLVVVGGNCRLAISDTPAGLPPGWTTDGVMSGCSGINWYDVVYSGGRFMAVGDMAATSGLVAVSPTGAIGDWTVTAIGTLGIYAIAAP